MTGKELLGKAKALPGWNATRVAEKMGISRENLNNKFTRAEPSINFILDLAKATETQVSYWLNAETVTNQLHEPGMKYGGVDKVPALYVIDVQREMIEVQRDNIKDKAEIISLLKKLK